MASAPANVQATTISDTEIDVTWDAVTGADGILIFRSRNPGVDTKGNINLISTVSGNSVSYTDKNLLNGIRYHYRLVSVEDSVRSNDSSEVDTVTDLPSPGTPQVTNYTYKSITAEWTPNHTNGDTRLEVRPKGETEWGFSASGGSEITVPYDQTSALVDDLNNGDEYEIRAVAITQDSESVSGEAFRITDVAPINNFSSDGFNSTSINCVWESEQNMGEFYLELTDIDSDTLIDTATVSYTQSSYEFTNNISGTTDYEVSIRVETDVVTGDFVFSSVPRDLSPTRPLFVDYKIDGTVEIELEKQDDFVGGTIEVYRSQTDGELGNRIAVIEDPSQNIFVDSTVEAMQTYYYTIRRVT